MPCAIASLQVLRDGDVFPLPAEWTVRDQPPYFYWNYFIAANTAVLNKYRESRGMTQFSFRPHAGEAGDVDHLAATFLTAESINHGINLRKNPTIQYLYYLAQIGACRCNGWRPACGWWVHGCWLSLARARAHPF